MNRKFYSLLKSAVLTLIVCATIVLTGCEIPLPDPLPDPGAAPSGALIHLDVKF